MTKVLRKLIKYRDCLDSLQESNGQSLKLKLNKLKFQLLGKTNRLPKFPRNVLSTESNRLMELLRQDRLEEVEVALKSELGQDLKFLSDTENYENGDYSLISLLLRIKNRLKPNENTI